MTNVPWHVYYFDGFENSRPPTRTELIEAESEDDAANVARSHMGRCKRVDIVGPRWAFSETRVILARDDVAGTGAAPMPG